MYEKPEFVKIYEQCLGTPRCCWLCQEFDGNTGYCSLCRTIVPEYAAQMIGKCPHWLDKEGIPF